MGRWSLAEKKFQIIILRLSHKVFCLLPSPSCCKMVRFTADSSPVDCQSTIIFQRGKCGQGESVARVRSKYRWLGTSKALRSSGPLPTLPLGLVCFVLFLLLVFLVFFPLFPWPWGIAMRPLNRQNTKSKRNKHKAPESHLACSYVARNL